MNFEFTKNDLLRIRDYPHLLGYFVGKNKLTDMHSDWIKMCWDSPTHSSFQGHRGSFKTTGITEIGPIYHLLFHPSDRIAIIRESYTEACKTVQNIARYFENDAIRALFTYAHGFPPEFTIRREGQLVFNFKRTLTKEGSIDAYGVFQIPTGSHYDKIDCDDIVTINSRISAAIRNKVKNSVMEIMTNIIDPGKQVMIVGTPWHYEDAWSLKGENGTLVIPPPWKYKVEDTHILTPQEIAEKKSRTSKALWAINYELDCTVKDEGQIFSDPIYAPWDYYVPSPRISGHIDAAWTGDCTTAATIMQGPCADGTIQIRGSVYKQNIVDCLPEIKARFKKYRVNHVFVENNPDKGYLARDLRNGENSFPDTREYHESENKDVKIVDYMKKYWSKLRWATEMEMSEKEYVLQVLDYRPGMNPRDAADSGASLLRQEFYPKEPGNGSGMFKM